MLIFPSLVLVLPTLVGIAVAHNTGNLTATTLPVSSDSVGPPSFSEPRTVTLTISEAPGGSEPRTVTVTVSVAPSTSKLQTVTVPTEDVPISSAHPSLTVTPTSGSLSPTAQPTAPVRKNPKRGIAFASGNPNDILNANQTRSLISWQYDWANSPPNYLATSNIQYIPMQWGSGNIADFIDKVKASGAKEILGFNEPDYVNEANMQPAEAAALWMQYIEPLKESGVRLGAPAVTASGTGRPWLVQFLAACSNCTIDFIPFHWYGTGVEAFYNYLWEMHGQFPDHPLWVTEFADTSDDDAEVLNFLNATTTYMDTLDWIERYAWFGYFRPEDGIHYNMLDDTGGLNDLGQFYVGATTVHREAAAKPDNGYITVNGADNPTQARVSVFPGPSSAAHPTSGKSIFPRLGGIAASLLGLTLGAVWTLM
ncbi:hypothetical protein AX16_000273 [Volvariella volvacea WC 439]|nr:hypothetical protein AX16_000273 [Volvariella volvacea WC 439]